jgi:hypothetical protein
MAKVPPPKSKKGEPPKPQQIVANNLDKTDLADLKPLNFKVPAEFHREFKTYAASHGTSMLELLRDGFALLKKQRGT